MLRHRLHAERKHQQRLLEDKKNRSLKMGSADEMEHSSSNNNLRMANPHVKQIMGSYVVRRRLSLAGIGIAVFGLVAVVIFVSMHRNGESNNTG